MTGSLRIFPKHPALRWAVPSIAAVAVAGGTAMSGILTASAGSDLPHRSAAQLLVDVHGARLDAISGTVVQKADLGLPNLSGLTGGSSSGGSGSSSFSSMVSGTHTVRLWYSGPDKSRIALMGSLGESDIVRNGHDVWTWSSRDNAATHTTLPAEKPGSSSKGGMQPQHSLGDGSAATMTPQQAADTALAAVGKTTVVSTTSTTVAGRSAYELVLQPKDTASLVGQVRVAIDGARHVPLRVQAFAKGATAPAFEVAFSQVSFTRPDAAEFTFTPPPGAKLTQQKLPAMTSKAKRGTAPAAGQQPTVVGTGWTSIVVAKVPTQTTAQAAPKPPAGSSAKPGTGKHLLGRPARIDPAKGGQLSSMLAMLPKVSGSWGSGHLLKGSLFSVLVTDDGRVLAGAVRPDALYAVAAK